MSLDLAERTPFWLAAFIRRAPIGSSAPPMSIPPARAVASRASGWLSRWPFRPSRSSADGPVRLVYGCCQLPGKYGSGWRGIGGHGLGSSGVPQFSGSGALVTQLVTTGPARPASVPPIGPVFGCAYAKGASATSAVVRMIRRIFPPPLRAYFPRITQPNIPISSLQLHASLLHRSDASKLLQFPHAAPPT